MSELIVPTLEVHAPVTNIHPAHAAKLGERLVERCGDEAASPRDLRRLLRPAEAPRADILLSRETANLHEYLDLPVVESDQLDNLQSFMRSVMAIRFGKGAIEPVATLPPDLGVDEETGHMILNIAENVALVEARRVARATLESYYGLTRTPADIWAEDDRAVTSVRVAESAGPSLNDLLRHLYVELSSDQALLPSQTEYGDLVIASPESPL